MLDSKILKENPQVIKDMLRKRKLDFPINDLIAFDKRRRELMLKIQEIKHKKNILANSIASKKKNNSDTTAELEEMKVIGKEIANLDEEKITIEPKFRHLMMMLPNLLDKFVPVGNDETDNLVIKQYGTNKKFNFKPKDHVDIATTLDLIDIESAAKISGARFYFLKNELVKMNQALINFALDFLSEKGYTLTQPPYMIRRDAMEGAVILEDFEDVIYKIEGEDLYLIGTSEHPIASMHMDEILDGKKLPIKYAGMSPCFRKEAGAHGKDMKGIFRVHQFGKVSAKTYDIEAWMPGQNAYREIGSCSNCTDYQSRRLSIRFRDKTNQETRLVHTLNSTLVATERTLVTIMENYQTPNGTVEVADILQKYMRDIKKIP